MQKVYFYFDDSGVLHKNAPNRYFVYGGLFFLNEKHRNNFKRKYYRISNSIKREIGIEGELKACYIKSNKHKASLFRIMKRENSMGLTVDINRVYSNILSNKKSIHRYKDYVLKRLVKEELVHQIENGNIDPSEDITISICVDEQATATDGMYSLRDSVFEELKKGIINYDYSKFHEPVFMGNVIVNVNFCDSSSNYLIQASDILANRIWTSFMISREDLRMIPNHRCLRLP